MYNTKQAPTKEIVFSSNLTEKEDDLFAFLEKHHFDLENIYLAKKPKAPRNKSKAKILAPYLAILQRYNLFKAELTPNYKLLQELHQQLQNQKTINTINTLSYAV